MAENPSTGDVPPQIELRDWFAGQVATFSLEKAIRHNSLFGNDPATNAALLAYEMADALLAARQKGGEA